MSSWAGFNGELKPGNASTLPTPEAPSISEDDIRAQQAARNALIPATPLSLDALDTRTLTDFPDAAANKIKRVAGNILLCSTRYQIRFQLQKDLGDQGDVGGEPPTSLLHPSNKDIPILILESIQKDLEANLIKIAQNGVPCSPDSEIVKAILYSNDIPDFTNFTLNDLSTLTITARLLGSNPLLDACQKELIKRLKRTPKDLAITTLLLTIFSQDDKIHELVSPILNNMSEEEFLTIISSLEKNKIPLRKLSVPQSITDEKLEQVLKLFPNIEYLSLAHCLSLTDAAVNAIATHLTKLQHLNLSYCTTLTDAAFKTIAPLTQLQHLNLTECHFLKDAAFKDISVHLKQLQHLDLYCCRRLTDAAVNAIATHLTQLRHLNLTGCTELTDAAFKNIATLTQLQHLKLTGCTGLTDAAFKDIATLTQLQDLNLDGCYFLTDTAIQNIAPLTKLQRLNLSWCGKLTDDAIEYITTSLTQLQYLDLSYNHNFSNHAFINIATLTQLQHLNLSNCDQFTDDAFINIATLTQLQRLDLSNCSQLTNTAVNYIATLTQLQHLDLSNCDRFTEAAVKNIATHLKQLQYLDLMWCYKITTPTKQYLQDCGIEVKSLDRLNRSQVHKAEK